jgi:hypothetical protein
LRKRLQAAPEDVHHNRSWPLPSVRDWSSVVAHVEPDKLGSSSDEGVVHNDNSAEWPSDVAVVDPVERVLAVVAWTYEHTRPVQLEGIETLDPGCRGSFRPYAAALDEDRQVQGSSDILSDRSSLPDRESLSRPRTHEGEKAEEVETFPVEDHQEEDEIETVDKSWRVVNPVLLKDSSSPLGILDDDDEVVDAHAPTHPA